MLPSSHAPCMQHQEGFPACLPARRSMIHLAHPLPIFFVSSSPELSQGLAIKPLAQMDCSVVKPNCETETKGERIAPALCLGSGGLAISLVIRQAVGQVELQQRVVQERLIRRRARRVQHKLAQQHQRLRPDDGHNPHVSCWKLGGHVYPSAKCNHAGFVPVLTDAGEICTSRNGMGQSACQTNHATVLHSGEQVSCGRHAYTPRANLDSPGNAWCTCQTAALRWDPGKVAV